MPLVAAVWIDPSWSVGAGDNSKELEVQTQRNRREKETFYTSQKDVPMNPKDPWDLEMDFDDSLTPEVPIDQVPDVDAMETESVGAAPSAVAPVKDKQIESTSSTSGAVADDEEANTDYELLTVLLRNPELVFALTSNKGENMPNEQTIALLDTLKQTGLSLSELVNRLGNGAGLPKEPEPEPEPIPASLPSPTPPDRTSRVCLSAGFPCHTLFIGKFCLPLFTLDHSLAGCLDTRTRNAGEGCSNLASAKPGEYTSCCKCRAARLLKRCQFVTLTTLRPSSLGLAGTDSS